MFSFKTTNFVTPLFKEHIHTSHTPIFHIMTEIKIKRIYSPSSPGDGRRILVDRLWPRGIKKADAALDQWARDIAPSTELRKWFSHDAARFDTFAERYAAELAGNPAWPEFLSDVLACDTVTLLYSARDEQHNNAAVLAKMIEKEQPGGK